MSRIGRFPIEIPPGVTVCVQDGQVRVEGPQGKLSRTLPPKLQVEIGDGKVRVQRRDNESLTRSLHGLTRALIRNMVEGVSKGYEKNLHIEGIGYRAAVQGRTLNLTLGYSHPVELAIPEGITVRVENQTELKLSSADKELLGQMAAEIRFLRKPEPYGGKGIRYQGEMIRRKVGKTATTAGGK